MKKKIIIVEDDSDILFTVTMVLENNGYDVSALSSGKTIMDGKFEYPDLFILDKRMPDMDGLDLCRQLRSTSDCKLIPIIIMSATPKFGQQALAAGANDFLAKPFSISVLLELVSKYLDK
jgi:DNA-binding response OmpR family regulator